MDITLAPGVSEPHGHPRNVKRKTGLLLINLGTPDATDYWSMRRYLSEFLSDRRVIELSPLLWQPILQGIILTIRPKKSGHAYEQIWNKDRNESPLRTITRDQADGLKASITQKYPDLVVDWAMRYGNPSIEERIHAMKEQGVERILAFALYPQYAASTTATAYDKVFDILKGMRWQPSLRCVEPYYDHSAYIDALAGSVKTHIAQASFNPDVVLASFHGLPTEYFSKGDPYYCHCAKTTRLLRENLGWDNEKLVMTFQSRFGPKQWLQPYTEETVRNLAKAGKKNLMIISPGFAADCVETLEEIAIGIQEAFLEEGGEKFSFIPCLNASDTSVDMMQQIALSNLQGWI